MRIAIFVFGILGLYLLVSGFAVLFSGTVDAGQIVLALLGMTVGAAFCGIAVVVQLFGGLSLNDIFGKTLEIPLEIGALVGNFLTHGWPFVLVGILVIYGSLIGMLSNGATVGRLIGAAIIILSLLHLFLASAAICIAHGVRLFTGSGTKKVAPVDEAPAVDHEHDVQPANHGADHDPVH